MNRFVMTIAGLMAFVATMSSTPQAHSADWSKIEELTAASDVTSLKLARRSAKDDKKTFAEIVAEVRGNSEAIAAEEASVPEGQKEIVKAQETGKGLNFVEVKDVEVVRMLPDDLQGRRHQKWVVQLANGRQLLAVYNSDMGDRVPLQVGETVNMGGQYIWDKGGGLIHWLHEDPKNRRPDGYVEVNGVRYGEVTGNH